MSIRIKIQILPVCLAIAALFSQGCASILSKSTYPVSVNSNPSGANVVVKNKYGVTVQGGVTPTVFMLNASDGFFSSAKYQLVFTKDGYRETNGMLSGQLDGWYFGNCLFGGVIGMLLVDPATGSMYKLPDYIHVSLPPNEINLKP